MKTIVSIPDDYSSVTIKQWQLLESGWSHCRTDKEKTAKAIEILVGLNEQQVASLTPSQFNKIVSHLEWVMDGHERDHDLVPRFTLNGVDYGFVPNWEGLSTGEFIDLDTFASRGITDHLPEVMAIMYRPITEGTGEWYEIEAYAPSEKKSKQMADAPMDAAMGALAFFLTIAKALAIDSHRYGLEGRQHNSVRSGGGIRRCIRWLTGMFSKSKK